ncbi:hypothetical protein GCM10011341_05100 [Frigidibacter albus]|nr:hypothetical protein [Frigidibacter albus]GGH45286.1 hypothetical protein GCM10011341_05100 [Frigidibacter albus]
MSLINPIRMQKLDALNYYTATRKYDVSFPRLTQDIDCDVVVIGGGFSGDFRPGQLGLCNLQIGLGALHIGARFGDGRAGAVHVGGGGAGALQPLQPGQGGFSRVQHGLGLGKHRLCRRARCLVAGRVQTEERRANLDLAARRIQDLGDHAANPRADLRFLKRNGAARDRVAARDRLQRQLHHANLGGSRRGTTGRGAALGNGRTRQKGKGDKRRDQAVDA